MGQGEEDDEEEEGAGVEEEEDTWSGTCTGPSFANEASSESSIRGGGGAVAAEDCGPYCCLPSGDVRARYRELIEQTPPSHPPSGMSEPPAEVGEEPEEKNTRETLSNRVAWCAFEE